MESRYSRYSGTLLAAMNPADTNYYYYVLNPETKQHEYSRTYAEHDALVQRYAMLL